MDRYTFYVLEFLEEINPASQTNMNDLVSIPFTWFQHVGVLALVWCVQSLLPRIPGVLSLHHGVAFSTVLNLPFFFFKLVSSSFKNLQNYAYLFVWVCIYVCMYMHVCAYVYICVHVCAYVHVQRPEHSLRESGCVLLSCGSWGGNWSHQVWWHVPVPARPSCCLPVCPLARRATGFNPVTLFSWGTWLLGFICVLSLTC